MRVLVFSRLFPHSGAPTAATFNVEQFKRLAAHAEIEVIAPIGMRERGGAPETESSRHGLRVFHPTYYYTPGVLRRYHGAMLARSVARLFASRVASFKPDVIYATWAYPDLHAATTLASRYGLPVVGKVHGSDIHSMPGGVTQPTVDALKRCYQVLSVSNDLRARCVALGVPDGLLGTVYNGVDHASFKPMDRGQARQQLGLNADARIVLYVGNFVPVKRVPQIVQGFRSASTSGRQLLMIGRGPQSQQIAADTAEDNAIQLLGPKPHAELPLYMNAADAVILFSRQEGVPNVLLEAMACGTPVIASAVGGIPEVVATPHCGEVLSSADDLPGAIDRVLAKNWDRTKLNQHAQSFSWEQNLKSLMTALKSAVQSHT